MQELFISGDTSSNATIIPLYDPYTGDPNLEYENLTGKINPLLDRPTEFLFNSNEFEPKKSNRFILKFPNEFNIPEWAVVQCSLPSMNITNELIFWNEIEMELYDPIKPSISKAIMKILEDRKYLNFELMIKLLDPTGVVIETWMIKEAAITAVNFGSLSFYSDNIGKIHLKITSESIELN